MRGATALFAGTKVIRVVLRVTLLMGFLMLGTAQAQITIRVPADVSTIQGAINVAINGDTVLVAPGTYVENLNFFGKAITVESEAGPEVTIIDGNQSGTTVLMGPGGALLGFTITGGFATFGAGMAVSGSGSLIKDNIFDGNNESSGGFGAAIGGNGASPTIEQNVFRNNSCDNQFLAGVVSFVNTSSPRIFNNLFVDNPCRAINMTLPVGSQPEVFNNTMVRNRTGVRVDRRINTSAQIYRNNLIVANEIGLEVEFGTEAENPTWENNLVFNNGTDYGGIQNQTGISSNVSADPLLTDLEFGNFHLLPGSPAIDAGTNTHPNLPPTDIDGDARVFDGNGDSTAVIDIGADEFGFTDLTLSATGLNFGDQTLNTSSTPQSVTVTNTGAVALHLRVEASGDFSVFSTCRTPDGIAPADSCQVEVTFTLTATGPRDSTATLTSNANGSPHLIALSCH